MAEYMTGILTDSQDGAVYNGHVYDCFLRLLLQDGQTLSIFDPPGPYGPISAELSTGEKYEMVLAVLPIPGSVEYITTASPFLPLDIWQGTIIAPNWIPSTERNFLYVHRYLCDREWLLLSTSYGNLLMNPGELPSSAEKKREIRWRNLRLDLCAVV